MAQPIDDVGLAWDSLRGSTDASGWRSISIAEIGPCSLRAGLSFPEKSEALLASFSPAAVPISESLPHGHGFVVSRVAPSEDGLIWIALTRSSGGSLSLFTAMVADISRAVKVESGGEEGRIFRVFLGRIRAWQEFMRKGAQALSPESEIGLVGELTLLRDLIDAGVSPVAALESWVGPFDGVRDFELGAGAIEVKTTLSVTGFPAKIGSLEQLDDSIRQPLFLAGVRLRQSETGQSLAVRVAEMRDVIAGEAEAVRLLSERLIAAGYFDTDMSAYIRRFTLVDVQLVEVKDGFPRLTLGCVPLGVTKATYEIDLDKAAISSIPTIYALKKLGVI